MAVAEEEKEQTAGGQSGDAVAARDQADAFEKDFGSRGTTPERSSFTSAVSPSRSPLRGLLKTKGNKRLAVIALIVVVALLAAIIFIPILILYKLVHIREDISNYFDKRHKHAIEKRLGPHYKAVFNEAGEYEGGRLSTGNPIKDAYRNFKTDRVVSDLASAGIAPVFDQRTGKLSGFVEIDGLKEGEKVQVRDKALRIIDKKGRVVREIPHDINHYHDLSDSSVGNRRSWVRTRLSSVYPEMGFFLRNKRARALDGRWGIKRKLLENKREKVADKKAELKKQLAEKIRARITNTDGASTKNADREKAAQDKLKEAEGHSGDAKGTSAKAIAANSLGAAVMACAMYGIADSISQGIGLAREGQLMRISVAVMATADQLKEGDLHSNQLGIFMGLFDKFEKSGVWQRISGYNKHANVSADAAKFSLSGGPGVKKISDKIVDPIKNRSVLGVHVAATACNVINSTAGTIAVVTLGVVQTVINFIPVADIADIAAEAGGQAAKEGVKLVIFSEIGKALIENVVKHGSGPVVTMASSGAEWAGATVAGYDNYSNNNGRSNGGVKLSSKQVALLNSEADSEAAGDATSRGIMYTLFSPGYQQSFTNRLAMAIPTSPGSVASQAGGAVAALMPTNYLDDVKSLVDRLTGKAVADEEDEQGDPTGMAVPQYGMTDELLDKYPDPLGNENVVMDYLRQKDPSFQMSIKDDPEDLNEGDDDYHTFVRTCLISDDKDTMEGKNEDCHLDNDRLAPREMKERFTVYRFDLGLANMINSYNNDDDDQSANANSDSGGGDSSQPATGDLQQLARQMLLNTKITYWASSNGDTKAVVQALADGNKAMTTCPDASVAPAKGTQVDLNPKILQAILEYGENANVMVNALTDKCHTTSGSNHYKGTAVDFECQAVPFDIGKFDAIARKYGGARNGENCAANKHWHYDFPK